MITVLLEKIITILEGWLQSFTSHAQHVEDKLDSLDQTASDIKNNTDPISDIKDNTGAVITPIQNIKTNTDSIATSSQTSANNTTAILNNVSTLSTNTGRAAAFAEDCANNTLDIKNKVTTIASDTTQLRADSSALNDMSDKIYEAIKWTLADKYIDETESGASPMSFDTDVADTLRALKVGIMFQQSGSGDPSLSNIRPITGYSDMNVVINGNSLQISLGQTVYLGYLDLISGVLKITKGFIKNKVSDMNNSENYPGWTSSGIRQIIGPGINAIISIISNIGDRIACNTNGNGDTLFFTPAMYPLTQSEWISTYPDLYVEVIADYNTPVEVQLTAQQIAAIKGINTIISDTNGDIEVTYKESIKHYLDKQDN